MDVVVVVDTGETKRCCLVYCRPPEEESAAGMGRISWV